MRINNNITAMNTHRQYGINTGSVSKSTEKLSSGYRINRAGDDAAGLAISEKMRAQIRGLTMASKNSSDAISLIQTAEGALQETHNILQRMRELAVQSSSDTNETTIDRDALNKEFQALIAEIDSTAATTKFNDMGLIDGSYSQNLVTTSIDSGTGTYSAAWASPTAMPEGMTEKTYDITHDRRVVKAQVTGVSATMSSWTAKLSTTKGSVSGASGSSTSISYDGSGLAADSSLNGTWTFGYDTSKNMFTATNVQTGEVKTAYASSMTGGSSASMSVDFGSLGKFSITNTTGEVIDPESITSFTGSISIKDGVTERDAQYADFVNLNGEEIQLEDGMSKLVFQNSDVSIDMKAAYHSGSATVATTTTDYSAQFTVERDSRNPFVVQTGANQYDELAISIDKMDSYTLGVKTASIGNRMDASAAISQVNKALNIVSTQRAALGALQNRLNHKINNLDTSAENLSAAESRIRDLDMAKEMTNFTKNNILVQASTAMLAQANAAPQGVLQLLG